MAEQSQVYDSSLKALVQEHAKEILPFLFPGVVFEREVNVENIKPAMRADKVFQVTYRGQQHLLHIEFESGTDKYMALRLLSYHAGLYYDHQLPVISMIVYPFRTTMVEPPLREMSGEEEILTFRYHIMALWRMKAPHYVQQHAVSMYALLPTMQDATDELLLEAIDEMARYYAGHEATLARQLVWMEILLRRSSTLSVETKHTVQRRLNMFERLWEEDPKIQQLQRDWEARGRREGEALGKIEGRREGEVKGKLEGEREMVVAMIELRFPALTEIAQQRVAQIGEPEELKRLFKVLMLAPDEVTVCSILEKSLS